MFGPALPVGDRRLFCIVARCHTRLPHLIAVPLDVVRVPLDRPHSPWLNTHMGRAYLAIACLMLSLGCAEAQPAGTFDPSKFVVMRTDGQRITGNAKLDKQETEDRAACIAIAKGGPAELDVFKDCMSGRGYAMVPAAEAEARFAEYAAARAARQKPSQAKPPDDGKIAFVPADRNEANPRLLALSEKDRRLVFAAQLAMSGETCGEVMRTLYRGSSKQTWNATWNVECKGGPSYSILVMSDEKGTTKVLTCGELRALGGGECFVRN